MGKQQAKTDANINIIPPVEVDIIKIGDLVQVKANLPAETYLAIYLGKYKTGSYNLFRVFDIDKGDTRLVTYDEIDLYCRAVFHRVEEGGSK